MTQGKATFNPETVKAIARNDYKILRQIACKPGLSIKAAGAAVDAELDRMTRAHIAGMAPDQATQFLRIYNAEYNRLVIERTSESFSGVFRFFRGVLRFSQ